MASTIAERQDVDVDGETMSVMHGVRHTGDGEEHIVTVPGTNIAVTAPTEAAAPEAVVAEIREAVALRRAFSHDGEMPPAEEPEAEFVRSAKADEKQQREAERLRLLDVSLEEIVRTRAEIVREHLTAKSAYSRAGSRVNAIGKRIKEIDAELTRRGELILDRRIAFEDAPPQNEPDERADNGEQSGA